MTPPKGPRTIEHVDRPLHTATELPGEAGMHARLLEVGEPVPDGVDATWHPVRPILPSVPIILHQTNLDEPTVFDPYRPPPTPKWLFTLGPIDSPSLVTAVRAHGARKVSLVLRGDRDDDRTVTAHWFDTQLAVDFDDATSTWWLDWTVEPINEEGHVWVHILSPAPEEASRD